MILTDFMKAFFLDERTHERTNERVSLGKRGRL